MPAVRCLAMCVCSLCDVRVLNFVRLVQKNVCTHAMCLCAPVCAVVAICEHAVLLRVQLMSGVCAHKRCLTRRCARTS